MQISHGRADLGPFGEVTALRIEKLDTTVFAIRHEHGVVRRDGDAVRDVELPRPTARFAPRTKQCAVRREDVDAGVAVAVAHEHGAVRGERHVARIVERPGRAPDRAVVHALHAGIRRRSRRAKREQSFAARRVLVHRVAAVVREPEVVVAVDGDPVRPVEATFSPRSPQRTVRIEHQHRVLAAVEHVHAVSRIDRDGRGFLPRPPRRQLVPVVVCFKTVGGDRFAHGVIQGRREWRSVGGCGRASRLSPCRPSHRDPLCERVDLVRPTAANVDRWFLGNVACDFSPAPRSHHRRGRLCDLLLVLRAAARMEDGLRGVNHFLNAS